MKSEVPCSFPKAGQVKTHLYFQQITLYIKTQSDISQETQSSSTQVPQFKFQGPKGQVLTDG